MILSDFVWHLHDGIITGIHKCLPDGFYSMSVARHAAHLLSIKILVPITVKCHFVVDCTCLQPTCHRKRFLDRPRFIRWGYTKILPYLIECIHFVILRHALDLFFGVPFSQIPRVIQIHIRIICHGKDFSIVWIHDNRCRIDTSGSFIIVVPVFFIPVFDFFFNDGLDICVDGCHQRIPVLCINNGLFKIAVRVQITVLPPIDSV